MSATTAPAPATPPAKKEPGIVIQTVEGFLCTNEVCDNRAIPPHCTSMNINRKSGEQVVTAYCESCQTLYSITRKLSGGAWCDARVEIVGDTQRKASFLRRVEHVKGIKHREAMSA